MVSMFLVGYFVLCPKKVILEARPRERRRIRTDWQSVTVNYGQAPVSQFLGVSSYTHPHSPCVTSIPVHHPLLSACSNMKPSRAPPKWLLGDVTDDDDVSEDCDSATDRGSDLCECLYEDND